MSEPGAPARDSEVALREVTRENLGAVLRLEVAESQRGFVANNAVSIAQAHYHENAWFRAIYAGEEPVGFVMLSVEPEKPEYWVWRLMIAAPHQGMGFGRWAMGLVVDHVRTLPGARELLLSHVPGEGHPGPFYESLGFEYTGAEEDGELVMRLPLHAR
jgi:diamine N-acetyltransferase